MKREDLVQVNKHTRAGREGKLIFCPFCLHPQRIYHFAWAGLWCSNEDCNFSRKRSNDSISKNSWLLKK